MEQSRLGLEEQERFLIEWPETWWEMRSKHRSSCSQDNNTTYFKQQRLTWQRCQKERPQHKIKCLKLAKENTEKPEAFLNQNVTFWPSSKKECLEKKGVKPFFRRTSCQL